MATVDCKVCGTETEEALTDHLRDRHVDQVFDITFDPATQHAEVRQHCGYLTRLSVVPNA